MTEERLCVTVAEAAAMIGIGLSKAYEMAMAGTLPSIKLGRRRMVPLSRLREWVDKEAGE